VIRKRRPAVNKDLAEDEKFKEILEDHRFKGLQTNPDYKIDKESEEYLRANPRKRKDRTSGMHEYSLDPKDVVPLKARLEGKISQLSKRIKPKK
jgi:hypothetical protein